MGISTTPSAWPPVIVGLIMAIYWARVMLLVLRTKRTVGRAANFIPPEPLGRLLRIVWIPVVALWILWPLTTPFVTGLPPALAPIWAGTAGVGAGEIAGWVAVAIALIAFGLTWLCWVKMGTSWRMGIDPNERTRLIFNGPYAYVRHPIYGLSQVLMAASLAALPSAPMALLALVHIFFMQWEVRREDKYLVQLHGPAYGDYVRHVGRFIPRWTPWKPST